MENELNALQIDNDKELLMVKILLTIDLLKYIRLKDKDTK